MQLRLAALGLCWPLLAAHADVPQSVHRMDIQTIRPAFEQYYRKYGTVLAAQDLAGHVDQCLLPSKRGRCDEPLDEAVQMARSLELRLLTIAASDYPDAVVTGVVAGMALAQMVDVLHTNLGEIQTILDRYAHDGK